jgi:hypothetical protein
MKAYEATPCSQSQIGRDCHLQRRDAAQVDADSPLSVIVRSGPFRTVVNGTLVARPVRMTLAHGGAVGLRLDWRVRPVLGDHRLVGKSPEARGSRTPGPKLPTPCCSLCSPRLYRPFELGGCRKFVPSCTHSSRGVAARPVSNPVSIGVPVPSGRGCLRRSDAPYGRRAYGAGVEVTPLPVLDAGSCKRCARTAGVTPT